MTNRFGVRSESFVVLEYLPISPVVFPAWFKQDTMAFHGSNKSLNLQDLACHMCHDLCAFKIFTCVKGHEICESCFKRVNDSEICPIDEEPMTKPLVMAEATQIELSKALFTLFPCRYKPHGCSHRNYHEQIRIHAETCGFRSVRCKDETCLKYVQADLMETHLQREHRACLNTPKGCPETGFFIQILAHEPICSYSEVKCCIADCSVRMAKKELLDHIQTKHVCVKEQMDDSTKELSVYHSFPRPKIDVSTVFTYLKTTPWLVYDGLNFFINGRIENPGQKVQFWVMCLGDFLDARYYKVKFEYHDPKTRKYVDMFDGEFMPTHSINIRQDVVLKQTKSWTIPNYPYSIETKRLRKPQSSFMFRATINGLHLIQRP